MTTKTVTSNGQYQFPLLQGGTATVGPYYQKTQNGANYTKTEPGGWPHAYTMTLQDDCTGVQRRLVAPGYQAYYPGGGADETITFGSSMIRPWTNNDDLHLYGKLADKYDDAAFNTPLFAGELGETTDMLADRLRQLAAVGRAVRRGNLAKAAALLGVAPPSSSNLSGSPLIRGKAVGNRLRRHRSDGSTGNDVELERLQREQTVTSAWLELQYGWKPLLSDISDLADAIAKRDLPRKQRLTACHFIGRNVYASPSCVKVKGTGRYQKSIVAYIEEVLPPLSARMGLTDPNSLAWELTPFSFVADWVYPIGDYLRARSLASRAKGLFVVTTMDYYHVRTNGTSCPATWGLQNPTVHLLGWSSRVSLTRTVSTSFPQIPRPVFRNPFGGESNALWNAVALVREIFGSKTSVRV